MAQRKIAGSNSSNHRGCPTVNGWLTLDLSQHLHVNKTAWPVSA